MPACSNQRKRLSHRQATSSPATSPHLVVGNGPPAAVPPSCPVSALHFGVEVLGAFSIEEALEMGAWFDDPDEQAAFERAVEARGLRLP